MLKHLPKYTAGIAAAAILAFSGAATSAMADPVKLRISTPAVDSDWHAKMLTVFKDELEKQAPGQFDVEIHLNASLFKQGTEPAAMQRGNLDMAMISAQDIAKQIPAWSVFTAGYLIRDPQHQRAVFHSDIGKEFYQMVADDMNIEILDVGYLGTRELDIRGDKKIETPADLAGVKLRMPGSDAWLFLGNALGANATPLAFGEVYTGLQTGTIDAQDNPLPTVKAAKFYEVTNQIVLTDHLVDAVFLSMAKSTYDELSEDQQKLVHEAAEKATAYNNENRIADEAKLLDFFKEQGLKVYKPDVDAFRKKVQQDYLDSEFAKDWPEGIVERINAVK
ncbi:sialic acid TRAP transporter substrate-binding protein SiaP [Thalassospira marina]|uniref:C4-dicarboxylate ABC transporter n=1 Tax=Thalassospira marina TaxID=2048283 RepID=A0A2N3KW48_9PROT|nr:sialic acid TRAP transporter substrate-binding protein SiaP [Thalassospira marina]AUG54798.1 C4-dicarboxylate ABC transporter [Thalassospira marina]PKR54799.1 C4-dicarboxylate ABC transporter [Thalassospira marina]